ncbi:MAG: mannose-1-phosphate guanyltransferase [Alphaproteobacteria bacterium]|nr:mannose-1-phosphate guanyltransferase [Alphaproteobacteria bacterium]MBU2142710.1 mannose-1-phosphate guanyltransferase [Alphaproteobacteria bacterium]MBU2196597.1 mannose-1-phosphate guanyltransferase [Alphaproteobacteria bacterium]
MTIYPVIMCGGSGTRLWPVSTSRTPKQFVNMVSGESLFRQTVRRVAQADDGLSLADPVIISNARYLGLVEQQLADAGVTPLAILLEPCARNTAAVAAVAAEFISRIDPDGLVLLLPADHFIGNPSAFRKSVADAVEVAQVGRIVTFGISPSGPETGFGYIKAGEAIGASAFIVDAFREKPDQATALSYLADGSYSWNAGIFLFPASLMQAELHAHAPDVMEGAAAALDATDTNATVLHLNEMLFAQIRSISIDYAVMEHTQKAAVVGPISCAWSDVGTWPAFGELHLEAKETGPILIDSKNCIVHTDDNTLVAALGVEDLVIAVHDGAVLVMPKSRAQDVKLVIEALKARGRSDLL